MSELSPEISLDPNFVARLRGELLAWFDRNARDLPWRRTDDPYAIWVSEIMLQQTQVATVTAYFERWMELFPTVTALAHADLDDVLNAWEGLGYYRRARYLHKGARLVVDDFGGGLPETAAGLQRVPGIGPYTAGAVASIAFGEVAPIVDGNVMRVLARLFALDVQPRDREAQKTFWSLARQLVDPVRPGDFNQSLMELGATVCTPKKPACLVCPVRADCEGFATGDPASFPQPARRAKVREATARAAVITRSSGDEVLMMRRSEDGLLAGMWQFPMVDDTRSEADLEGLLDRLGVSAEKIAELGEVSHRFSHIAMTIVVSHFESSGGGHLSEDVVWTTWPGLRELALPTAVKKVERLALGELD